MRNTSRKADRRPGQCPGRRKNDELASELLLVISTVLPRYLGYTMSRLALIVVFVAALLAAVATNAAKPRRISHNESGSYEAFPDVCRLADGELVAVFYAGYGHISLPRPGSSKDGRICIMRSQDDGRILCLYYVEERPGSRICQAVFRVNGETITCESSTLLQ